jgi:LysM repeat protein
VTQNFVSMKKFYLLTLVIASVIHLNAQTGLMIKNGEKGLYLEHTVAAKEGLYAIGRLYNVNPKFIASYNKMDLNGGISIGQVLRIPLTDTNFTQKAGSGTPVYYHVGESDGLLKVSNEHKKVSLKNLRDWNNLTSDNIQTGSNLIVGFLVSKEMTAQRANELAKKPEPAQKDLYADERPIMAPKEEEPKTELKTEPKLQPKTELPKTEPIAASKPEIMEEKKQEARKSVPVVVPPAEVNGYFRASFEQQVKAKPPSKSSTVTSGIFKTTSGWQDAKYYLLIDGVSPGTIVRITNPDNNKAVYAKVLGEMNGIRQNEGLDIRISNAAASALQVREDDKFVVSVNY